jgi:RNA polymerase sigma-70 factor (ECF subfamily)
MSAVDSLVPFQVLHERLKAGDLEAWDEFYRRYEPLLRRIARRWLTPSLRRQADSIDVVQSIFRIALAGMPGLFFESEGRLLGWLDVVTRHRVSHLARREKGPGGATLAPLAPDEGPVLGGVGPEEAAARAEEVHRLKAALDRLPPDEREVVLLRDFEGLAFAEVAERLARPSAEAARKLHDRARARLTAWVRGASAG